MIDEKARILMRKTRTSSAAVSAGEPNEDGIPIRYELPAGAQGVSGWIELCKCEELQPDFPPGERVSMAEVPVSDGAAFAKLSGEVSVGKRYIINLRLGSEDIDRSAIVARFSFIAVDKAG